MNSRILFCTHEQFWPLSGGGTAGNYHLVREFTRQGFDVTVSCPFYSDIDEAQRIHRVQIAPFSPFYMHRNVKYRSLRYVAYSLLSIPHFFALLISNRYDLIIINNALLTWPFLFLKPFSKAPVVVRYTDLLSGFLAAGKNMPTILLKIFQYYELHVPQYFDQVDVITENMKKRICDGGGVDPQKVKVIYDGVDTQVFNAARIPSDNRLKVRRQLNIPLDAQIFMYHGMVEEQNGSREFPQLIEQILNASEKNYLLILGTGRGYADLQARYQNHKRVRALDFVSYTEIPFYIDASDAGFIPYPKTPSMDLILTLKLLEYLSLGTPCVCYDLNGIKEVFENSPFVGVAADTEEFIRLLMSLAGRGKSSEAIRIIERDFSWVAVAKRMIKNFSPLLPHKNINLNEIIKANA
jgi:glycosyltransferase involved in cell wall biosynthesis